MIFACSLYVGWIEVWNRRDRIIREREIAPRRRLRAYPVARSSRWIFLVWVFLMLPTTTVAVHWPAKLHRLVAPFRANPFLQTRVKPCSLGLANCLLPASSTRWTPGAEPAPVIEEPSRVVPLQLRTAHRGPFAHHWLEVENSTGRITLGFGPATVPFIDAGQVSLQDRYGNIERISGMHPLLVLGLPPLNYQYSKAPGAGHTMGQPIQLTVAQADALVQKLRHPKFVGPYVPIFHDCRTFVCAVQAVAQGRSSLPCYFLLKGYW